MSKILIGADPEFFVKLNGVYVSAHGLVEGTKEAPQPVEKGAVQVDGTALEYCIEPAANWKEWRDNNNAVLGQFRKLIPPEYTFHFDPVANFGKEYIDSLPEEVKKLGCTPDYNAYTGEQNPTPNADTPFRTASGHIHIGWTEDMDPYDEEHFEACRMLVRQLDVFLGLPSLVWDTDNTRRSLYGKAGAFRPKSYGVEYRVLSNAWLRDEDTRSLVYALTSEATKNLLKGIDFTSRFTPETIQNIINKGNILKALKFLEYVDMGINFGDKFWDKAMNLKREARDNTLRDELGRWKKKAA